MSHTIKKEKIPRSICGSGGCISCPFSNTEESYMASGCLPDGYELIKICSEANVLWGCHSEPNTICGGFAKSMTSLGKFDPTLPVIDFDEYSTLGFDVAIALAQVRKGINPVRAEKEKNTYYKESEFDFFHDYSRMTKK